MSKNATVSKSVADKLRMRGNERLMIFSGGSRSAFHPGLEIASSRS